MKCGDEAGLRAIQEAIIFLSGQPSFTSYKPGMVVASGAEYSEARSGLLDLAERKEFFNNPYETQKLISAFKFLNSAQDFNQLISDVHQVGGSKEAHALLLLSNEMWCYVQLSQKSVSVHRMKHRLQTTAGKKVYAQRKVTSEPVFGIIKAVIGFRSFMLRGCDHNKDERN